MSRVGDLVDKASVSSVEYYKLHPGSDFNDYWYEMVEPLYVIEYWKVIDNVGMRDLVEETFKRFNFEDVEGYMHKTNWCWHNSKKPPTIEKMKKTLLGHINSCIESDSNTPSCASGGFEVYLSKRSGIPVDLEIKFKSKDDSLIVADTKTDISFMRKKKMKILLKNSE